MLPAQKLACSSALHHSFALKELFQPAYNQHAASCLQSLTFISEHLFSGKGGNGWNPFGSVPAHIDFVDFLLACQAGALLQQAKATAFSTILRHQECQGCPSHSPKRALDSFLLGVDLPGTRENEPGAVRNLSVLRSPTEQVQPSGEHFPFTTCLWEQHCFSTASETAGQYPRLCLPFAQLCH